MAAKKKAPKVIGKLIKVTVILATNDDEVIDEYVVADVVCDDLGRLLDIQITEKLINEF